MCLGLASTKRQVLEDRDPVWSVASTPVPRIQQSAWCGECDPVGGLRSSLQSVFPALWGPVGRKGEIVMDKQLMVQDFTDNVSLPETSLALSRLF